MSAREEDRRKNSCSSRGLGVAAAAIGVGVGAALYCFFSKGPEYPDNEGSTSQEWSCEQPQALDISSSSDYTTVSEHTTTDTSVHRSNDSIISIETMSTSELDFSDEDLNSSFDIDQLLETIEDDEFEIGITSFSSSNDSETSSETGYITLGGITIRTRSDDNNTSNHTDISESDMDNDWDVTNSSEGIPRSLPRHMQLMHSLFSQIADLVSPTRPSSQSREDEQTRLERERAFRERAWSLEECSICFEVMLKDQPLMALPCTHNFHVQCIGPWLQERQTCPVCRKNAE